MTDENLPAANSVEVDSAASEAIPAARESAGTKLDGKSKKDTVRKLFVDRMAREGRGPEWFSTVKTVMNETGKGFWACSWEAMRRMGYTTAAVEHGLHREYLAALHQTSAEVAREKVMEEIREERRIDNFEEAVRMLPDSSSYQVELNWIRSHPAMARQNRSRNKLEELLLTAEDVLYATAGRAPSKAAVYQLQHWANHPNEFYKQLLSEQKKATEGGDGAGSGGSVDVDMDEVERLLKEVKDGLGAI